MGTRAVIFDMDGTLVDSGDLAIATAAEAVAAWAARRGVVVAAPPPDRVRSLVGLPSLEYFAGLLPAAHAADAGLLRDIAVAIEDRRLAEGGASLFPGARALLDQLRADGLALGLVSNCGPGYFGSCLRHLDLARPFDFTACLGDRPTKTENVAAALVALGARGGAMVGDRAGDLVAGAANGLRTLAVLHGYGDPVELADADAVVDDLHGARAALRRLLGA